MPSRLIHAALAVAILFGIIVGGTTLSHYLKTEQDQKATDSILHSMAKECQQIKKQNDYPDSFEGAAFAIEQMLGTGINTLNERSYLLLISLCVPQGGDLI
jgi:hypothetical protein